MAKRKPPIKAVKLDRESELHDLRIRVRQLDAITSDLRHRLADMEATLAYMAVHKKKSA